MASNQVVPIGATIGKDLEVPTGASASRKVYYEEQVIQAQPQAPPKVSLFIYV